MCPYRTLKTLALQVPPLLLCGLTLAALEQFQEGGVVHRGWLGWGKGRHRVPSGQGGAEVGGKESDKVQLRPGKWSGQESPEWMESAEGFSDVHLAAPDLRWSQGRGQGSPVRP